MTGSGTKTAVLAGASGLVGGFLLRRLVNTPAYARILVVTRRDLGTLLRFPRVEQLVVDFRDLSPHAGQLRADAVFCALGTTLRKAKSKERFREVDYEYPLGLARVARDGGARHFSLVSSLGANTRSLFFYSRVKGEIEAALQGVGFPSVAIFRPSVIDGPRAEVRIGERIGRWLGAVAPRSVRSIHADAIAAAMVARALAERPGVEIVLSRDMHGSRS